jgi:hypothetical protein
MSVGADIGWTVIFSIMIINAIIGNIVVFWIVLCEPKLIFFFKHYMYYNLWELLVFVYFLITLPLSHSCYPSAG